MQAPTGFATYEDLIAWMGRTHNDVSLPAQTLLPTLADRLTCLGTITDHARMTGSGSACFGLCCSQEQAEAAEEAFASAYPGDWVRVTSLK
jgi:4-diphosphocytidyl-2-C-methyl-D-erythritol kinase